jgi:hypothetical protein
MNVITCEMDNVMTFPRWLMCTAAVALASASSSHAYPAGNENEPDPIAVERYKADRSERRLFVRAFDRDLWGKFIRLAGDGDASNRNEVRRLLLATLVGLDGVAPSVLASRITTEGSADGVNFDMRDACLHFAMLYRVSNDAADAKRAAALLARFAQVIPAWPIWNPYSGAQSEKVRKQQGDKQTFSDWSTAGLWGDWIYSDLIMGTPLLQAARLLDGSGAVEQIGATEAVRRMFELHMQTQRKFSKGPQFSNMDAFQIRGLLDFGFWLPDPEVIHEGVRQFENIYHVGFYPDGWWHEGSTAYHFDLQRQLTAIATELLVGYSDPPGFVSKADGRRFDQLDLRALVRLPSQRAELVARQMVLPDQTFFAVHDTDWPQVAPYEPSAPSPVLYGAVGQASLASGSGLGLAVATLHWGGTTSHGHRDALNLNLWACGAEVVSETQYRPMPGSASTREWHTSTAGHATVVVDGHDQSPVGSRGSYLRRPQQDDPIPGIADWPSRWTTCAAQDAGKLRIFDTRIPEVQVVEADAEASYDRISGVSMYRRTVALVRIDDRDTYVVDIFRVKGGATSDYLLHSCLQREQHLRVSVPLSPLSGMIHGFIGNLQAGKVDGPWLSVFDLADGLQLINYFVGTAGTTVIQGEAPAMRRAGSAPFLAVRRNDSSTTYAVVHHAAIGGTPRIQRVESLQTDSAGVIALRIHIGSRIDTVISCEGRSNEVHIDGGITCRAQFAHIAQGSAIADRWAYMVDGDKLTTPRWSIEGETSFEGSVVQTQRREGGANVNGFIVGKSLPVGRALEGQTVIMDLAGQSSWAYRIGAVSNDGVRCVLETPNEPGFDVFPGGLKQTYFPCWGFRGDAKFRIPGHVFVRLSPRSGMTIDQTSDSVIKALP